MGGRERVEMKLRILNLGAGVQSTAVALMVHRGELPPIDAAVFADVGEEPSSVYLHLKWLIHEVSPSFPVHLVTNGRLGDALVVGRKWRKGHTTIPAFTLGPDSIGQVRRQCTGDYKIEPVERFIRRELLGVKPRCRVPKGTNVTQLFGLSYEEMGRAHRVTKSFHNTGRASFSTPAFPLIDRMMKRGDCLKWLSDYGVPHPVERSACVFCPYKSNREWQRLKLHDPDGWNRAVEIDGLLRVASSKQAFGMKNPQFLHRDCVPIGEIDFSTAEERGDQGTMGFYGECQGMCGT